MRKDQFIEYIASKIPDDAIFKDHTIDVRFESQGVLPHGTIVPMPDFNISIDANFVRE